uniref:Uncharacterized protein n=1 Tax=Arundo donax TaxID=35708 RepID=A0A0A8ZT35_ARUDO
MSHAASTFWIRRMVFPRDTHGKPCQTCCIILLHGDCPVVCTYNHTAHRHFSWASGDSKCLLMKGQVQLQGDTSYLPIRNKYSYLVTVVRNRSDSIPVLLGYNLSRVCKMCMTVYPQPVAL